MAPLVTSQAEERAENINVYVHKQLLPHLSKTKLGYITRSY